MVMKNLIFASFILISSNIVAQNNIEVESRSEEKIPENTYSFNTVEKKPTLNGSEHGFLKFIFENIKYPNELKEKKIAGIVYLSFTINDAGNIKDIKILSSEHELFSKEAIRLAKECPKWEAGEHNGKKVNVTYNLPINFTLD